MDEFNDIKIKSNNLLNINECIICTEIYNKCVITKCGHSFCEKCILNCINLNNCCPTCKTPIKKEEIVKNYLIDDIISYVKSERSKEEYDNIHNSYLNIGQGLKMNLVQIIFFENLKQIFNSFNSFSEKIEREHKMKLLDINKEIDNLIKLGADSKIKKVEDLNIKKQNLEKDRLKIIKDLEISLEKYMKNLPESPLFLPIKTRILIDKKNITLEHLSFTATESTDKLYDLVKNYFQNFGDEIEFNDSAFYIMRGVFQEEFILIEKGSKFISTELTHGDSITLKGNFCLKSDAPKECLTYKFEEKHMNGMSNYFSCENCKLNCKQIVNKYLIKLGLCPRCIECCHKDHSVKLHIENQKLTWACCYCYRGICALKNNKSK